MPQIFCIIDDGGRTLVTRAQGDIGLPSFPTAGLLCSISTYSDSAGYSVETFGTENVHIIYRKFKNHLLFVLATSNLLAHPNQLQALLQVVFDGLVMLLGPSALNIEAPGQLDSLRKKLRGLNLLDMLVMDDSLVPCVLLQAPQVLGLPNHERQALLSALDKISDAVGTGLAAMVSEGWYMVATPEWWMMTPQEAILIQHITTHVPETEDMNIEVYLTLNKMRAAYLLKRLTLDVGLHLVILCRKETNMDDVDPVIEQQAMRVQHILQTPVWCLPPLPQFSALSFDMCMVVQSAPAPRITLFWGHSSEVPVGFNPLMSPTLKRQLASSTGGGSNAGSASSLRSVGLSQKDFSNSESLQLYYRSCIDMLVSFMLQQQLPRGQLSSGTSSGSQLATIMHQVRQDAVEISQSAAGRLGARGGDHIHHILRNADEVHLVTAGNRLVALTDALQHGLDVFVVFPKRTNRVEGRECAQTLRSVFQMSYNEAVM
ncbi:hypothetical protein CEUSTIGMA_g2893.t1 [Chlamydomonas eustigma]|uniref:Uncharacterized protein n=1 Tax=Chlamydomonas eustigma TaxID=1157962 RepID=A0A250WXM4_9CHLO|nr:hypothetical protein CEUSTIGMA_g2893.t1 [Chlamydomonas eustigma]|eukprot:GAX75449.1 hypothetical protein CEUSTIGMA_g2893.t1 [Chlamydomonas eustigma]